VRVWAPLTTEIVAAALKEATRHGVSAVDALHLASAAAVKADLFVTTERPPKPLHRSMLVNIISISP